MTSPLPDLDSVREIPLQSKGDAQATLLVAESGRQVPFAIARVFTVAAAAADVHRGRHAHKSQKQFLVCLAGEVEVTVDDGYTRRMLVLDGQASGLYVPEGIWAEQVYRSVGSILMVFSDAPYDEADYIRDYERFLEFRRRISPATLQEV